MKPSRDSMMGDANASNAPTAANPPTLEKKNSWFRKSFIGGRTDGGVVSPPPTTNADRDAGRPARPEKRSTWHAPKISSATGLSNNGAPMMILPSIRPVSPLSDAVSVQAARAGRDENGTSSDKDRRKMEEKAVRKIGRQLSVASTHSQHNGYANGTQQAVDKLNGNVPGAGAGAGGAGGGAGAVASPTSHKEGFFSHLRKRARRLSGRTTGLPPSPEDEDLESGVGCGIAWGGGGGRDGGSNRSSMLVDSSGDAAGIDRAIKEVDAVLAEPNAVSRSNSATLRRNPSFPPTPNASRAGELSIATGVAQTPNFPRTRRSVRNTKQRYETPDENDELVGEVPAAAAAAGAAGTAAGYDPHYDITPTRKDSNKDLRHVHAPNGYPTPSPQANHRYYPKGLDIGGKVRRDDEMADPKWPTPPSEGDGGWGQHLYAMARR